MPPFFAAKLKALGGNPKNSILARFGATKMVGGVKISTVPALHSNGLHPKMIGGDLGKAKKAAASAAMLARRPATSCASPMVWSPIFPAIPA